MRKALYTIVIVLLVIVFGFSAFQVVNYVIESKEQGQKYDDLSQLRQELQNAAQATEPKVPEAVEEDTQPTEETGPRMLPEYAALYEMNDDLVGWIFIPGTRVDYPVMQTPDRTDYYLKRNFNGDHSEHGCIYIREECDIMEPSDNITIYGHNMMDGSMFAALHDYIDKETWENNPLILFDNLYEYHTYEIFAVFKTTASMGKGFSYHQMVDAESEEAFDDFIATCKSLAFYDTGITPEYGDKIICLSTCEYTLTNGRLVVAARRID